MSSKKQTAVQWLQEAMSKKLNGEIGPYFLDLFENAKAMEMEQIIDAYKQCENLYTQFECDGSQDYYTSTYE